MYLLKELDSTLGSVDGQEFLFFGKHLLKLNKLRNQATNLISLLSNAVSCFVLVVRGRREVDVADSGHNPFLVVGMKSRVRFRA